MIGDIYKLAMPIMSRLLFGENIILFHWVNFSSSLSGKTLVALDVDSGVASQPVVKFGHNLVTDSTIVARGTAVLCISTRSMHTSISYL